MSVSYKSTGDLTMENERQQMGESLYGSTNRKDQNSMYERQLDANGAILGMGMQELKSMAAMGGNEINLDRGVAYQAASMRKPYQTRNSQYDMLGGANYEDGTMGRS